MLVAEDCVPCIMKMVINGLRYSTVNSDLMRKTINVIMEKVMGCDDIWEITSAELVERVLILVEKLTGIKDLFLNTKIKTNSIALALKDHFKGYINSSDDPLFTSTKLSITANIIDNMILDGSKYDLDGIISTVESLSIDLKSYKSFAHKLNSANSILFIGDNSAEALFDMLFIETIKSYRPVDVSYVVRHEPTLNDISLEDAMKFGLNNIANVVTNGIIGPLPGTILRRCSEEVRNLIKNSDIVIVKGGGNFETLSEEAMAMPNAFFLLMCKCKVHMAFFNKPIGEGIIWHRDSDGDSCD